MFAGPEPSDKKKVFNHLVRQDGVKISDKTGRLLSYAGYDIRMLDPKTEGPDQRKEKPDVYNGAAAVLIFADTVEDAKKWIEDVQNNSPEETRICFVQTSSEKKNKELFADNDFVKDLQIRKIDIVECSMDKELNMLEEAVAGKAPAAKASM